MLFRIKHLIHYTYEKPASHSHNEVRLAPLEAADQKRIAFSLDVKPAATITEYRDSFGNLAHSINIEPPHTELVIAANSVVDRLVPPAQPSPRVSIGDYLVGDSARIEHYGEFLNPSRYVPFSDRLRKLFWSVRPELSEDITAYTERMMLYVRNQFDYDGATTHVHSTVDDILTSGGGVCQDFAHLSIGLLRLAGIPARYVSGYFAPDPNRGRQLRASRVGKPCLDRGTFARYRLERFRSDISDTYRHPPYSGRGRQRLQRFAASLGCLRKLRGRAADVP